MDIALFAQLQDDIKTAMRARDKNQLMALRTLHSELKNASTNAGVELSEALFIDVVSRAVKQRRDAAQQYQDADRPELAEIELAQIALYERYLPKQLDAEAIEALVKEAIAETGASSKRDMGQVMKVLMPRVKGQADGKQVNQIVGKLLG